MKDPLRRKAYDQGESLEEDAGPPMHKQKSPGHVTTTLYLTLEELYAGVSKQVSIHRDRFCIDCKGVGGTGTPVVCTNCKGEGRRVRVIQVAPGMLQQMVEVCPICTGLKTKFPPERCCQTCRGTKLAPETANVLIHVDKGASDKSEVWVYQEGSDYAENKISGDVSVTIHQLAHPRFERKGLDLMSDVEISLSEALCGFTKLFSLLDDRVLKLEVPAGTTTVPGSVKRVSDEGMIHKGCRGHLFLRFKVTFPDTLPVEDVVQLKLVLPPVETPQLVGTEEECEMCDSAGPMQAEKENEEEEEGGGRHPVQCGQS